MKTNRVKIAALKATVAITEFAIKHRAKLERAKTVLPILSAAAAAYFLGRMVGLIIQFAVL
jgi:sialic acid synthase SpsE